MNLIVQASLTEPPTDFLSLRIITQVAVQSLHLDCLIESEQDMKDLYFHYLVKKGLMDFISDIITPDDHIEGLRLANEPVDAPVIKVKAVYPNNSLYVLGQVQKIILMKSYF